MAYISNSPEDTMKIAYEIGRAAKPGDIYCLNGDLGSGKTVFAKGFAKGLDIPDEVTSPTFAIVNEYKGRLPLYHFDVYRISSPEEMEDTGYEEYFFGAGVCLIEWAHLIEPVIPQEAVWITIKKDIYNDNTREIEIEKR
ncbi:MAG: tRNA (adenosine(37)-N6)-threonylcarbamoyltransferase complex ATPase subunit type 1 TsaE [Lachnospiraceae bacterium]|nr:tRNA (adenosine(37)-N6)-threonylcarbamoyltransferase complex ATPase subunit type 1 TsaE [Lachnospiraceae bacterium]